MRLRRGRAERKMNCMQVGRSLQSYLDGEIDESTAHRIAEHLKDCRRCGMEVDAYTELKRVLASRAGRFNQAPIDRLREFSERLVKGEILPEGEYDATAGE